MKEWTFKVFIKSNGRDAFEEWMDGLDAYDEEKIRARLDMMSITKTWIRPYFSKLSSQICEIIIKGRDKQYRPLGCIGPGPQVFTLLIGASKESKKRKIIWSPSNALETAEKRRKLVFEDRRYVNEYRSGERNKETVK